MSCEPFRRQKKQPKLNRELQKRCKTCNCCFNAYIKKIYRNKGSINLNEYLDHIKGLPEKVTGTDVASKAVSKYRFLTPFPLKSSL